MARRGVPAKLSLRFPAATPLVFRPRSLTGFPDTTVASRVPLAAVGWFVKLEGLRSVDLRDRLECSIWPVRPQPRLADKKGSP